MSLQPGTRLGVYEVSAKIGEGGTGEVWQATDTQLNRQVALKILPDAFADDPDRLSRFQRKARILASLNRPTLAQIRHEGRRRDQRISMYGFGAEARAASRLWAERREILTRKRRAARRRERRSE